MTATVNGWCPGALRPMMSGDGLLVRLRPHCGTLAAAVAREIAGCAEAFGNGLIELTSRANLQIRGVAEAHLPALQQRLSALGLLDTDAASEAVRNVIASPLAGADPRALLDIRPLVAALEERLGGDALLAELPGKFGFAVEDGGTFDLAGVETDVAFRAHQAEEGLRFKVFLAGMAEPFAQCLPDALADVASTIAQEFLRLRAGMASPPRRMRGILEARVFSPLLPSGDIASGAKFEAPQGPAESPRCREAPRGLSGDDCLGIHALGETGFAGIGKPFGRWQAREWQALADLALVHVGPQAQFHLTPWRSVLLAGVCPEQSASLGAAIAAAGGILDPADPRLAVAACPGAPACASATTATQVDASGWVGLARQLQPRGIALHVSGCAKSCARHERTGVTLVARDGRYDLVLDGTATNRAIVRGLDVAAATRALEALAGGASLLENLS